MRRDGSGGTIGDRMKKARRLPQPKVVAPGRYPIRAVSRLTGLGIDTLRAWERRHHAVTPSRDDRGRIYTDADVDRLRLLRDVVARGHSIGRVARLDRDSLRGLADGPPEPAVASSGAPPRAIALDLDRLMAAIETFDAITLDATLSRAAALLDPAELMDAVLIPLLVRVGDDWHAGRGTIAHEHFLSTAVRSVLGSVLRTQRRDASAGRLLFATPSGEPHEFGTLGAALLAAGGGAGVLYLGADLPADEIVSSAAAASVDAVVLGVTSIGRAEVATALRGVARRLPPDVELWIGGPAAAGAGAVVGARAILLPTYRDFERQIARLRGPETGG
jgi:MerR family transcriptional regulator, light-induced transcriptional regulator